MCIGYMSSKNNEDGKTCYVHVVCTLNKKEYNEAYPIGIILYGYEPEHLYNSVWEKQKKTIKEKLQRPFVKFYKRVK